MKSVKEIMNNKINCTQFIDTRYYLIINKFTLLYSENPKGKAIIIKMSMYQIVLTVILVVGT